MRDTRWVGSESRGSLLSLCSQCQSSSLVELFTAKKPLSQHGQAVTFNERDVLREKEGRRNVSDGLKV